MILPDRRLWIMPRIVECPSTQEVYADVGTVRDCGEIVRILFAVQLAPDRAEQNLAVVMRRSGFVASLVHASWDFLPGIEIEAGRVPIGMLN